MKSTITRTVSAVIPITIGAVVLSTLIRTGSEHDRAVVTVQVEDVDLQVGDRVCFSSLGISPPENGIILIVTSGLCPSCASSKAELKALAHLAQRGSISSAFILPPLPMHDALAREVALHGKVVRLPLADFGVLRTPSILRVERSGVILSMWTGTVSPENSALVQDHIFTDNAEAPIYGHVTTTEIALAPETFADARFLRLMGAPAEAPPRHHVIPASDLEMRAPREMPLDQVTIVDCGFAPSARMCQEALLTLFHVGYRRLFALSLPRRWPASIVCSGL